MDDHVAQPSYSALQLEIGDFCTSVIRCCVRYPPSHIAVLRRTCRDPLGISRLLGCGGMSPRRLRGTLPVSRASWGQSLSPRFRPRPLAAVAGRPPYHWLWPDGWDSVSQPMSKIKFRRQASLSLFYRNTLALSTEQGYYSTIPPQSARGCAHFSPHGDSKSSPIRATNAIDSATEVASYRKGDKPPRP